MKVVKRIIVIIITIILFSVLSFNLYNLFCQKILKQDLPSIGGYAVLEVISGSMEPTINIGDLIIIDKNASSYQENDIVTFYDVNGSFVTHRIVSIADGKMITKGDNKANSLDDATSIDNIVGKYVFKISFLGNIIQAFKNPLVSIMIFIIGILICFLISYDKKEEYADKDFLKYIDRINKKEKTKTKKVSFFTRFKKKKEKKKKKKIKRKKKPKVNGKNKKKRRK